MKLGVGGFLDHRRRHLVKAVKGETNMTPSDVALVQSTSWSNAYAALSNDTIGEACRGATAATE
jgi:hypothetical protein